VIVQNGFQMFLKGRYGAVAEANDGKQPTWMAQPPEMHYTTADEQ